MSSAPVLSVVIVNYMTSDLTLECVRCLSAYPPQVPFEALVLDNGSDPELEERLAPFPFVRFFSMGENAGYARANNFGILNSHGRYVLLLNNDAKFTDRGALQAMLDRMEETPEVGALGPRHVDAVGRFQVSCGEFPTLVSEAVRKLVHYRLSINDFRVRDYIDQKYAGSPFVDWLSGSCLLLRRKALEDVGLLDEQFFMYFEDVDLCRRLSRAGWKSQYFPRVTVTHCGGASAKHNLLAAMIENRRSQIHFARKYYGRGGGALMRAALLAKYGVNLLRWTSVWAFTRLWGIEEEKFYLLALLAKKVMGVSLQPLPRRPGAPRLHPVPSAAKAGRPRETAEMPHARLTKE